MVQNTSHDANWTVCDTVSEAAQGGHAAHSTGVTVIARPARHRRCAGHHSRCRARHSRRQFQQHLAAVGRQAQPDRPGRPRRDQRPWAGYRRARAAARRAGSVQRDPGIAGTGGPVDPEFRCRAGLPAPPPRSVRWSCPTGWTRPRRTRCGTTLCCPTACSRSHPCSPRSCATPIPMAWINRRGSAADQVAKLPVSRLLDTARYPGQPVSLVDAAKSLSHAPIGASQAVLPAAH